MKKNWIMRLASCLMVLAVLSTCAVSGTYAKYVTTASGSDSARVASWGFKEASINLTDLFKTAYDKNVKGEADVIAPGTTNSAKFQFSYKGTQKAPEVAYEFVVDTTGSSIADDIKNNTNIQWQLDGGKWGTWDELMTSIKTLSGDASGKKTYEAGTLPTGFGKSAEHTVAWQWVFETKTGDVADATQDAKDTAMGNKADLDNVSITITITATQID